MQKANKPLGLARNGTNFKIKCGCVPLIYGKPCGSDKRIRVRKHCRLTAKFNIHSAYTHRRWRQGSWPPTFTGQCLQVYQMFNTPLTTVTHCKYLGVTIQSDLKWSQQITRKANNSLSMLQRDIKIATSPFYINH